jgi:hypothetical protein
MSPGARSPSQRPDNTKFTPPLQPFHMISLQMTKYGVQ